MNELEVISGQQRNVLRISNILVALGVSLNLSGLAGTQDPVHRAITIVYFLLIACFVALQYFSKMADLRVLIGLRLTAAQLLICVKMVLFVLNDAPNAALMITTHMVILAILLLLALLAYLHYLTYILSFITLAVYTCCAYILDSDEIWRNLPVYILLFSAGAFLSSMMAKGINAVLKENAKYKINAQDALTTLGVTEAEFLTFLELTKESKIGDKKTLILFNVMSDGAREMLKKNVAYIMEQDNVIYDKIGEFLPEFTPSEVDIAKLIIEGKKISDMIPILNKKKSNITCQRTKMRGKLNLNEKDNLRDAILKRVTVIPEITEAVSQS